eukprot:Blabericola_migrator_1__2885@NODE_182_length_11861_cov_167_496185_g158_i0_p5_GENE_NODE_182_length_11861_cov_167_496185_g158_i0NODE_182_length_11861_cov_167_496185_g158_i0_p5_ORF_typecomplete_len336_score55_48Exo_endo_phos/PF03372_23/4_7e25Exo_endo_phos_2/PF14529_6/1_4e07_NODE_182_length_11861_cov_167_496185_g158_i052326239
MAMKRKSQTKVKEDDDENNVNENVKRVKYNPHVDGRGPSLNGDWREQVAEPTLAPDQIKICTWNVNGLRAVLRSKKLKEESSDFVAYIKEEAPDILCLNETKITPELENLLDETLPDYKSYHAHSDKKSYAGVAILVKKGTVLESAIESQTSGVGDAEHDSEGRTLTLVFPSLCLVASYVANSGQGLKRLDYRISSFDPTMQAYLKGLETKFARPVIWCGDLNVAYEEIDIWNSKGNQKSAGHTPEERASFGNFLKTGQWVDVWRQQNPSQRAYTYWSARFPQGRADNLGWRLDYFICSLNLAKDVGACRIRDRVQGSDHCPVVLILDQKLLLRE